MHAFSANLTNNDFQEIEHQKKRKIAQKSMKNCMFFGTSILRASWHDFERVLGGQNRRFSHFFRCFFEVVFEARSGRAKNRPKRAKNIEGPQGGKPPPPNFGKALEERQRQKRKEPQGKSSFPHLSIGVAECGKHNQRKAGALEAPQSSLDASKSSLEAPKSRPRAFKIEARGLQNRGWSPPRRHV